MKALKVTCSELEAAESVQATDPKDPRFNSGPDEPPELLGSGNLISRLHQNLKSGGPIFLVSVVIENQNRRKVLFAIGLLWGLAGCASIGVRNPEQEAANPKPPGQIFIADFDTSRGAFHVNRSDQELIALQQKTSNALADYLVADISKSVMPATRQNGLRRTRANAWLITGEFVRVNQGSRVLRGLIGLGAGGTKMETIVRVYDLSRLSKGPVLQFETSGGSNAEPGALLGGLIGALPNALRNAGKRGISDDTARTAREITAMVGDYYAKSGGQPVRTGTKPKILTAR
jgi:Domain of unknown function (DUF4410)